MMIPTRCPLGGRAEEDEELYPANFDPARLDAAVFSARRAPDRIHYRMVRNRATGSVRADPVLDAQSLARLYERSAGTYGDLIPFANETYLAELERALALTDDRRGLLEIGCGSGWFLDAASSKHRFDQVAGVEPSIDAAAAAGRLRSSIRTGLFRNGMFPPESFSVVCGFQVLDHVAAPNELLAAVREVLAPGGVTLWILHDRGAPANRLLGRRSPIVDIEHAVLYDRRTVAKLFENNGFEVVRTSGVANRYPLWYWAQLAPVPRPLKNLLVRQTRRWPATLKVNLGNMGILARKALSSSSR